MGLTLLVELLLLEELEDELLDELLLLLVVVVVLVLITVEGEMDTEISFGVDEGGLATVEVGAMCSDVLWRGGCVCVCVCVRVCV